MLFFGVEQICFLSVWSNQICNDLLGEYKRPIKLDSMSTYRSCTPMETSMVWPYHEEAGFRLHTIV